MKLFQFIQECKNIGIKFFTEDGTTLEITGDYEMVKQNLPMLDKRKAEIIEHLSALYSPWPYDYLDDIPEDYSDLFGDTHEMNRINYLAWELMRFYGMTFPKALRMVSEIIAPGGIVECKAAYETVLVLMERLKKR